MRPNGKNVNPEDLDVNDAMKALTDLAWELELEPINLDNDESADKAEDGNGNNEEMDDDRDGLLDEEAAELAETFVPIWLMLAKVGRFRTQLYHIVMLQCTI